jgi:peptidyl-prolyl cis-trans isomerase D
MLETIRKRQRILLIIVTALTIVSFVWFLSPSRTRGTPQAVIGKMNGRSVTMEELEKVVRSRQLAYHLQLFDLLEDLGGMGSQPEIFGWNTLLVRDEAKRLQLDPSVDEIRNAEKKLAAFQTNGQFDGAKYQEMVDVLQKNGLTAADIDSVVADHVRLEQISALIRGSSPLPEAFYRQAFEKRNQVLHCSFIRLASADFEKDIQVTDQDIEKYYKENGVKLQTPEKKKIEFVAFTLADDQKKLDEKAKQAALKTLADQAEAFVQPLQDHPDQFDQVAQEKGLKVQQTGLFELNHPDPSVMTVPELVQQVQSLTKEQPLDEVQGKDGFYVVRLLEVQPSRPLTLDEAKDQITTSLRKAKLQEAISQKGQQIHAQVDEAIKAGATFADSAQKAGYKAETATPFALGGRADPKNPAFVALQQNPTDLQPGQTSGVLFDNDDGLLVHLDSKDPIDENKYQEEKKTQYPNINDSFARVLFREWLRVTTQKAGGSPFSGPQNS